MQEPGAPASATIGYKVNATFVTKLLEKALLHGFGVPGYPEFTDVSALQALVDRYSLGGAIETAYRGLRPAQQLIFDEARRPPQFSAQFGGARRAIRRRAIPCVLL